MYPDTLLFIVGAAFAAAVIVFVVYLITSRKRSRVYTELLKQESEKFDAITATLFMANSATSADGRSRAPGASSRVGASASANVGANVGANARGGGTGTLSLDEDGSQGAKTPGFQGGAKDGFNPETFAGIYAIEREIGGGAMSRTFQVRSVRLGNPWFMKFIPSGYGALANEVNILKLLNHASLPKIIDIFHAQEGVYLIETLVEGVPLDKVYETGIRVSQYIALDWFEQMAQVLKYLHGMKPSPIFHLDLKPGNIMVTHDNRLVLVDFGISRRRGENTPLGMTASYAAPEQFNDRMREKYASLVQERFGNIPARASRAPADARTDIYGLGVIMFELLVGKPPTVRNINALRSAASDELGTIIRKCLHIDPFDRYQTADELLDDLRKVKGTKLKMARALLTRRLAAAAASLSLVMSGGAFTGGYYIFNEESAATIYAQPEIVTVSLQQSSEFAVRKQLGDGHFVVLDSERIAWEYSGRNIARIDGGRISGINEGQTVIHGKYREKGIDLTVRVIRPVNGLVDVSQRYEPGRVVALYSGKSARSRTDGSLENANFMSPESIAIADDGTVYVADSGEIRAISGGVVGTLAIQPDHIKAAAVRCRGDELYILSEPWQDGDKYHYALARVGGDGGADVLYVADAMYTAVEDFAFGGGDGLLYFIDRNEGLGGVYLKTLDPYYAGEIKTLCTLPAGSRSLAVASGGDAYVGNAETGVIQIFRNGKLEYFAGIESDRAFIDGISPRFYSPQKLEHRRGYLYIWDFNTLRRIEADRGTAGECITLAGMASPEFDAELGKKAIPAEDAILPFGNRMDFAVSGRLMLIADSKHGVVWEVRN